MKKLTNTQCLGLGATTSLLLLGVLLLRTLPQRSQQLTWTLVPYETQVLPLSTMVFARRTLEIQGNMNATNIYWTHTCPSLEDLESEVIEDRIEVRHRSKQQKDFFLTKESILKFKLERADGQLFVAVFSSWADEQEYEHRPKENLANALKTTTIEPHQTVEFEIQAHKTDSYVFLYQGRTGQEAYATYSITRRSYNVQRLQQIPPNAKSCSYNGCSLVRNDAGCLALESTLKTRDLTLQIKVGVEHFHGWTLLVSLLPLLLALIYVKYNGRPVSSVPQTNILLLEYQLVTGESE
jgi:hypothetical protein